MKLFKEKAPGFIEMKKEAKLVLDFNDIDQWGGTIREHLLSSHPYLSKGLSVFRKELSNDQGDMMGYFEYSYSGIEGRIPVIVNENTLDEIDTMIVGEKYVPLDEQTIKRLVSMSMHDGYSVKLDRMRWVDPINNEGIISRQKTSAAVEMLRAEARNKNLDVPLIFGDMKKEASVGKTGAVLAMIQEELPNDHFHYSVRELFVDSDKVVKVAAEKICPAEELLKIASYQEVNAPAIQSSNNEIIGDPVDYDGKILKPGRYDVYTKDGYKKMLFNAFGGYSRIAGDVPMAICPEGYAKTPLYGKHLATDRDYMNKESYKEFPLYDNSVGKLVFSVDQSEWTDIRRPLLVINNAVFEKDGVRTRYIHLRDALGFGAEYILFPDILVSGTTIITNDSLRQKGYGSVCPPGAMGLLLPADNELRMLPYKEIVSDSSQDIEKKADECAKLSNAILKIAANGDKYDLGYYDRRETFDTEYTGMPKEAAEKIVEYYTSAKGDFEKIAKDGYVLLKADLPRESVLDNYRMDLMKTAVELHNYPDTYAPFFKGADISELVSELAGQSIADDTNTISTDQIVKNSEYLLDQLGRALIESRTGRADIPSGVIRKAFYSLRDLVNELMRG